MRFKCYYNRNLKMSPEKLAAQVGHLMVKISETFPPYVYKGEPTIVVLKASATKFKELQEDLKLKFCAKRFRFNRSGCWHRNSVWV